MKNTFSTTHYLLILDRSGSMQSCWNSTMNALEKQIKSILSLSEENPELPIRTNVAFKKSTIEPFGGTALLDAIGTSLHRLKSAMKPDDDAVVVILTDGEENSSSVYSYAEIEKLITRLKETNKWKFTLLGADFDAFRSIGSRVGFHNREVINYDKKKTEQTFDSLSADFNRIIEYKKSGKGLFGN
jgi:hypothetical protein